jgi:hypothetical protein
MACLNNKQKGSGIVRNKNYLTTSTFMNDNPAHSPSCNYCALRLMTVPRNLQLDVIRIPPQAALERPLTDTQSRNCNH